MCVYLIFRLPETFAKLNLKQKKRLLEGGLSSPPQRREKLITHCFLWIFRPVGRMVGWKAHPTAGL
ncbi:MAG: hypothetical protein J5680_00535 [Neisseriaceae bacterium]|nr:hypothetical protein [Neisseriaceae bacterium]